MDTTTVILSRIDDLRATMSERLSDLVRVIERQNGRVTKLEDTRTTVEDTHDIVKQLAALEPRVRSLEDDRLKMVAAASLIAAMCTLWGDRLIKWVFGG